MEVITENSPAVGHLHLHSAELSANYSHSGNIKQVATTFKVTRFFLKETRDISSLAVNKISSIIYEIKKRDNSDLM